jgi:hypothetical protein
MGIVQPDEFGSYEEADDYACMLCSAYNQGSVDDYNSNPGDYGGYEEPYYDIYEE